MARPRQVSDLQILESTRRAVFKNGAQVSLDLIAQEVGVTSPALLKRFGTRQALLIAALYPDLKELEAVFLEPVTDDIFEMQLETIVDRLSQYFSRMLPRAMALRQCFASIDEECAQGSDPPLVRAVMLMTQWLSVMRARKVIETDMIETAATAIVGAVSTRMITAYLTKRAWSPKSQEKYQRELVALFANALGAKPLSKQKTVVSKKRTPTRKTKS